MVHAGNNVWTSFGPEGGRVYALALDPTTPTTLYAGTGGGGVFKSTTGGASWSAVNTGLTNTSVRALAIERLTPSTLYAGTFGGGVFALQQKTVDRDFNGDGKADILWRHSSGLVYEW